ncbi:MAG: homoserine O-succinyltransferase [Caulobacteraceae bacterium]|nr:homoserine O-succinyltransferase [Caulobacteraceae bacterium]
MRIGLVNSMPDGAMAASERQFRSLLQEALPGGELDLVLFELAGLERHPAIRAQMARRYQPAEAIADAGLDALVVTGAKPGRGSLRNAPFWPGFVRLVDQAVALRLPTLWSCLAAHAAVDHLDGIGRRALPQKHSGVFACAPVWSDPLLEGIDRVWGVPHSRLHDLAESDLRTHGYDILLRSPTVGVDTFVKRGEALFLFCQGHPEYDRDSLALEYRRDLNAYLQGQRPAAPAIPSGLLDPQTEAIWRERADWALAAGRVEPQAWPLGDAPGRIAPPWRPFAAGLYANWLRAGLQVPDATLPLAASPRAGEAGLSA